MTWLYLDTDTPLGVMRLAARACEGQPKGLSGAWFLDQPDLPELSQAWRSQPEHPVLNQARVELADWFAGDRQHFDVEFAPQGTVFQQRVWQQLRLLDFGAVCSYSDIAMAIGKPKAARAVAQAIGRNPLCIFIPCHRVVGRDTALTGFSAGLPRKHALLRHEGHRYLGHHARVRRVENSQLDLPW
ncbi:methylated-DNA--[protein]-cysteine S-methyltransferase [Bordetella sp. 02P26C-1]|uniref:methylated-DNA--[protein]-cysteine S-methyltransferase n=1 Tax=Bordetella sp. 02P26C-1 TaxID=2683195 RepID=UPI0013539193|nr:methylated-DNA--[protein]-cysteine S-methyltransferase [Bordetella sp. 02P26C-1]MVW79236.1 methylated-DNA--[protein]-cysteine S-methyltransferase [Bordetella sp. 02P26C-1]